MWIDSTFLLRAFIDFSNNVDISKKSFNTRMTAICKGSNNVYKKREYINDFKTYKTWYLFIVTDKLYNNKEIKLHFTAYKDNIALINYDSDRKVSDRNDTANANSTLTDTTINNIITTNTNDLDTDATSIPKHLLSCKWHSPEAKKRYYYSPQASNETIPKSMIGV